MNDDLKNNAQIPGNVLAIVASITASTLIQIAIIAHSGLLYLAKSKL